MNYYTVIFLQEQTIRITSNAKNVQRKWLIVHSPIFATASHLWSRYIHYDELFVRVNASVQNVPMFKVSGNSLTNNSLTCRRSWAVRSPPSTSIPNNHLGLLTTTRLRKSACYPLLPDTICSESPLLSLLQQPCQFLTTNQLTFSNKLRSTNTTQAPVQLTVLHSYPGPHALSPHNYDYPQTRHTKNQVHFSLSPIQCRSTSKYTSSQSLSIPKNSRQYCNQQILNSIRSKPLKSTEPSHNRIGYNVCPPTSHQHPPSVMSIVAALQSLQVLPSKRSRRSISSTSIIMRVG